MQIQIERGIWECYNVIMESGEGYKPKIDGPFKKAVLRIGAIVGLAAIAPEAFRHEGAAKFEVKDQEPHAEGKPPQEPTTSK